MCGIGFFILKPDSTNADLGPNTDLVNDIKTNYFPRIKYRGPDSTGYLHHKEIFQNKQTQQEESVTLIFAHHRLAIIHPDKTDEEQPFKTTQGTISIMNGEVYTHMEYDNYRKHLEHNKQTFDGYQNDCAIVPIVFDLTRHDFKSTIDTFKHMDCALILYDSTTGLVYMYRDYVGLKPLFIAFDDQHRVVGAASEAKVFVGYPEVKSIEPLLPNNCAVVCPITGKLRSLFVVKPFDTGRLERSLTLRVQHTNVPLAFLCSGGIDSSVLVSLAKYLYPNVELHAFMLEYKGTGGMSYDLLYGKLLMDNLKNVNYTVVPFTKKEGLDAIEKVVYLFETFDVNTIRAGVPMYLLAKYIADHTKYKVVISGEGADELYLGYEHFTKCQYTASEAREEQRRLVSNLYSFDLLRAERAFASNGLELRVPYLDPVYTVYLTNVVPIDNLIPGTDGVEKNFLRQFVVNSSIFMPDRILWRQKERLSDGIGTGWVPELIRHAKEEGFKDEQEYYKSIYDKFYGAYPSWILPRVMPKWAQTNDSSSSLLVN
jgi:asparagine synthase (glutamine-hydrolysing)